jgi:hypothetical protein
MPIGKGKVRGILSAYNGDLQILLNDTTDMQLYGERCPFGAATDTLISIEALRNTYQGVSYTVNNRKIRGVVISHVDNNPTNRNLVIQDRASGKGMTIRFASGTDIYNDASVNEGDSVEVVINGLNLQEFNGQLQLSSTITTSGFSINDINKIGPVAKIVPRVATIMEILQNWEAWESTLVKVNNPKIAAGAAEGFYTGPANGGFNGGLIGIYDQAKTDSVDLYTSQYSAFKSEICPATMKSVTGVLIQNKLSTGDFKRLCPGKLADIEK